MAKQIAQIKHLTRGRDDAKILDFMFCSFSKISGTTLSIIRVEIFSSYKINPNRS